MSQFDDSLVMDDPLDTYLSRPEGFKIFSHSSRTRVTILCIFISYLAVFVLFLDFLMDKIQDLADLPEVLLHNDNPLLTHWLFYFICGLGFLASVAILIYFMWSLIDIWGLQVWVNKVELRVQNTIMGPYFKRWTGVGSLKMEEITELKGTRSKTFVRSKEEKLHFSPVDKVDLLIDDILASSKNATIR